MPIDVWFFLVLVTPPLVLVHELGHALVGLVRTRGVVHVVIGAPPGFLRARVGRLALELSLRGGRGVAGYARTYALGVPAFDRFLIAIGGPFASALAAAVCWSLVPDVYGVFRHLLLSAAAVASFHAILNLLPCDFVGRTTIALDGKRALEALRSRGRERMPKRPALDGSSTAPFLHELNQTWTRWFAFFSQSSNPVLRPVRSRALAVCALVNDVAPESERGRTLTMLAAAGWCWREVEQGQPSAVAAEVRVALKNAAQTGAVRPELQVRAACQLLASPAVLAQASAGRSEHEKQALLARASRSVLRVSDELGIPAEQCRLAFMYGVALRDVERFEPLDKAVR
jgi:hypothetical protein